MASYNKFPSAWASMPGFQVGSTTRCTTEPGGSTLYLLFDRTDFDDTVSFDNASTSTSTTTVAQEPMTFDFINIGLPSLQASAYSTALLAQHKWKTMGISRLMDSDQITGSIECPMETYIKLMTYIGEMGTARVEVPSQNAFCQWRVALLGVSGVDLTDGDRMTGSITLTVTNTGSDSKTEVAPVFGVISTGTTAVPLSYGDVYPTTPAAGIGVYPDTTIGTTGASS